MPKPITFGEQKKLDQIAKEITDASEQSGKGIAVNQTPTFQVITTKGAKIRIARAFSNAVGIGNFQNIRVAGKTAANHTLYTATGGAGGTVSGDDNMAKKGLWARLLGW